MRLPRNTRFLSNAEIAMAKEVFGSSLPAWERILITDALGIGDRPFTVHPSLLYVLNLGPDIYPDATLDNYFGDDKYKAIFIHEMTHVWQYYHDYNVVTGAAWAQSWFGKGYDYTIDPSDSWDDFNIEQQAHLVQKWFDDLNKSQTADEFVFIDKIIRAETFGFRSPLDGVPLADLRKL
jgi:type VI secretion system secreted protein VgrG